MKTTLLFFAICFLTLQTTLAQNVGIGNTTPLTKLDINGDIAFRSADITINGTYTYALDVNTVKQSHYKLKPPVLLVGNFILAGITEGTDGRIITLTNYTPSSMEIYDEDLTANANDRIKTGIGTTLAVYPNGSVTLQYDVPEQRWLIKGGHNNSLSYFGGGGGGSSYWNLSGTNIFNNNAGNVGIGTNSPNRAKFEVNGVSNTSLTTAIFGGDGNGLSFQRNWPTIGFNQYRDIATGWGKAIANGYGMHMFFNPANGSYSIAMQDSVAGNAEFAATPKNAITTFKNGYVHIGSNNISDQASLSISGAGNFPSHFNFGNDGHTYIRGGSREYRSVGITQIRPSKVYINDIPGIDLMGNIYPGGDVIMATGGGNVGVGTNDPKSPLSFPNILGKKISFWNSGINDYGIGLQSGTLQIYTAGQDQIAFGWGSSANFQKTMTYYPGTAQLGINCLPQAGYNLAVDGKIKAKEIVVELNGWADYVFEDNYKLASLESVEEHLKANKHLPGIPSAEIIQNQGLSLGAVQTKMMEKIEELTLYIINLEKRLKKIESFK